jgi:lysozyme
MPLSGIDVSVHQNLIDWTQVAPANLSFAYARASLGITGQDRSFATNWAGIASATLFRGAYHVFYPDDDPTLQAQNFIAALAAANGGSPLLATGDLPAMVDVEIPLQTTDPLNFCNVLLSLLGQIALATGRTPIIYTNRGFWDPNTASSTAFAATYPLWVAEYGVAAPHGLPAGWANYTFWQHTEKLPAIPGTNTLLDGDYFNGALTDLQALALA